MFFEFDSDYERLRFPEWQALFEVRFGKHIYGLNRYGNEDEANALAERIKSAFCSGSSLHDLPIMFEDVRDRRDVIENEVLIDLPSYERAYLKAHPEHLGIRCEAYLLGLAVEQLLDTGTVTPWQRERLGALVMDALLEALPIAV
jgi:hypothetical protein